jgi:predicted DNA-binding transcriptional regulator AlpA
MTEGAGQLLSQRDVCERLRISRSTFFRLPYFQRRKIRIGRAVRYRLTDVIAFAHERAA